VQNTTVAKQVEKNNKSGFSVRMAETVEDIKACQKLRYEVFAVEMGADLKSTIAGCDQDHFDTHCRHLMVIDEVKDKVIATTRVISNENAESAGSFYSETEFDISNIIALDKKFIEIGRTCVHVDYRTSPAINHLWQGVAKIMIGEQVDYLFGCVSIPLDDNGQYVQSLIQHLKNSNYADEKFRVEPFVKLQDSALPLQVDIVLPSLLKRYLNIGAVVCGEPCLDAEFNVADIFILVDTKKISKRYQRHFLESA